MKAYTAIHELGVCHGDIKGDNIIIDKNQSVWIIDFEFGREMRGPLAAKAFADEMEQVQSLLKGLNELSPYYSELQGSVLIRSFG